MGNETFYGDGLKRRKKYLLSKVFAYMWTVPTISLGIYVCSDHKYVLFTLAMHQLYHIIRINAGRKV